MTLVAKNIEKRDVTLEEGKKRKRKGCISLNASERLGLKGAPICFSYAKEKKKGSDPPIKYPGEERRRSEGGKKKPSRKT